jgi:hypothetical protein
MTDKIRDIVEESKTRFITMNNVPISVYRDFLNDIDNFNNSYWVKLKELMLKAKAFDLFLSMGYFNNPVDNTEEFEEEQEEKDKGGVTTFGGLQNE